MTYTQAQIDKANAVDLEKFLRAQGETLVRSGKEYRWKAHDSLTVCGNKWFRHSQSKGGLPVDFVMEFYGKSFPEPSAGWNHLPVRRRPQWRCRGCWPWRRW